jgi:YVTN family beta-propeller protein
MLEISKFPRAAAAALLLAIGSLGDAAAQTVGVRIPVGTNPSAIAVNPVTNKIYVTNESDDTVSIINANTNGVATVNVGDRPLWVAINAETNRIYASNLTSANTSIINGANDTIELTTTSGGGGWTAINPLNNTAYVVRYGAGDEVNVIQGTSYILTFATRSFSPVGIAVNPVNNWLYNPNSVTGDVSALDITTPTYYPPLKCPDGLGGFKPQPADPPLPPTPDPYQQPCIDITGTPVAVAINPVANKIFAVSTGASGQIFVINGTNHTFATLNPPGAGVARTVAVNPVTNMAYAAFANAVVAVDSSNTMTVIPAPGPMAIGINPLTNMIYVPNSDGTLLVINGQTGSTSTVALTPGSNGIAVNPITNMVYVLDAGGGVTPVLGAAGTATATGISASITPLPGNTGSSSGTISVSASSSMTPAPLNSVRRVYYRIGNSGPWSAASGTGPFTVSYSGLAPGSHTLHVFATNGLEAPNINTHLANVPVVGNIASYTFTVQEAAPTNPPRLFNIATRGQTLSGDNVMIGGFIIEGSTSKTVLIRARGPSLAQFGVPNTLQNPQVQLYSGQTVIASNDNWGDASNASQIQASGFAPENPQEAAIYTTLAPGGYTAIVTGFGGGTGIAIVEVFEIDQVNTPLANIATRGLVGTGDNVMIGGFIIHGDGPQQVLVRARGPSLAQFGVPNTLQNPRLQLYSGQTVIASNDNWVDASNRSAIEATPHAPQNSQESAILMTLNPGGYTAIVSGVGDTTGIAIVEVFKVN